MHEAPLAAAYEPTAHEEHEGEELPDIVPGSHGAHAVDAHGHAAVAAGGAYGVGLSQEDMMNKDLLILVDEARVTGAMLRTTHYSLVTTHYVQLY